MQQPAFVGKVPPHVAILMIAHIELVSQIARTMLSAGTPPPQVRDFLSQHVGNLVAAGELYGLEEAAGDMTKSLGNLTEYFFPLA